MHTHLTSGQAQSPTGLQRRRCHPAARWGSRLCARLGQALSGEAGMSTVEYAIGTLAAAAFAAVLYQVVTGDTVAGALNDLVRRALSGTF